MLSHEEQKGDESDDQSQIILTTPVKQLPNLTPKQNNITPPKTTTTTTTTTSTTTTTTTTTTTSTIMTTTPTNTTSRQLQLVELMDEEQGEKAEEVEEEEEEEDLSVIVNEKELERVVNFIKASTDFNKNPKLQLEQVIALYSLLTSCIGSHKFTRDKLELVKVCVQLESLGTDKLQEMKEITIRWEKELTKY